MKYKKINIPNEFAGNFFSGDYINNFDRETAKQYFRWYMSVKNERIVELERAVQTTKGYENWKADLSIESLDKLQKWFENVVDKRSVTEDEKKQYMSQFSGVWEVIEDPIEWTITEETKSLCHDVGIYFAEMLIKMNPHLHWGQDVKSKRSVDFNYPIVISGKKFQFNSFTIAHVSALKALKGKQNDWQNLYKYWDDWAKENKDNSTLV